MCRRFWRRPDEWFRKRQPCDGASPCNSSKQYRWFCRLQRQERCGSGEKVQRSWRQDIAASGRLTGSPQRVRLSYRKKQCDGYPRRLYGTEPEWPGSDCRRLYRICKPGKGKRQHSRRSGDRILWYKTGCQQPDRRWFCRPDKL